MTSLRQIEANRRNALKSTGPRTENGKRRSRRNAFRHGLTAETVIEVLEDTEDYGGFEAAIIADYDARTAIERELVLRLASLLWRIRRATSIETGLLRIQAEILRGRRHAPKPDKDCAIGPNLRNSSNGSCEDYRTNAVDRQYEELAVSPESAVSTWRELTYCFLRLTNLDNGAFDRIGRYETCLWRQIAQTLFALQAINKRACQIHVAARANRGYVSTGLRF
jgi:hypothetical protein